MKDHGPPPVPPKGRLSDLLLWVPSPRIWPTRLPTSCWSIKAFISDMKLLILSSVALIPDWRSPFSCFNSLYCSSSSLSFVSSGLAEDTCCDLWESRFFWASLCYSRDFFSFYSASWTFCLRSEHSSWIFKRQSDWTSTISLVFVRSFSCLDFTSVSISTFFLREAFNRSIVALD